ncbi:MAG: hypothetical protein DMG59_27325 [Acidobacteria bacterium]|nr:MAG: hypothetical protein DMG59_27325 [Acidobacteriota bacterium]
MTMRKAPWVDVSDRRQRMKTRNKVRVMWKFSALLMVFLGAAYGSAAEDLDEARLARGAVVGDNRDTHSLKATFFYWSWRSKPARVLIGNNLGKVNGWVEANGILGKVVAARLKSYLLDAHRFML